MAKANKQPSENERVKVTLTGPDLIQGGWHEKGDEVEVYPFQKRHMVDGGRAEGKVPEDVASQGEKDAQALDVLKPAHEREGMIPSYAFADSIGDAGYGYDATPGPEGDALEQSGQPPKE